MFCHKCGSRASDDSAFCRKCGTKLILDDDTQRGPEYSGSVVGVPHALPILPEKPRRNTALVFVLLPTVALIVIVLVFVAIRSTERPYTPTYSQSSQMQNSASSPTPSRPVRVEEPDDDGINANALLGTWTWEGKNFAGLSLGYSSAYRITFLSSGSCTGEIALSNFESPHGDYVVVFSPTSWSFLNFEQMLQVSGIFNNYNLLTGVTTPTYQSHYFKVTIEENTLRLENIDNVRTNEIVYTKTG